MKYKIWYEQNNKLKTIILEGKSLFEIQQNSQYPLNVINIKEIKKFEVTDYIYKNNNKELLELFYEISIMLEANLPIDDLLTILLNTKFSQKTNNLLEAMQLNIKNGKPIYKALQKYKSYVGNLPVLFFRLGEQNSNLALSVKFLYQILNEQYKIRQTVLSKLIYPAVLIVALFVSVGIIFEFVIPKFEYIFSQFDNNLPYSTYMMLQIKTFIDQHYIVIVSTIFILWGLGYAFYLKYRYYIDRFVFLNIPYFSNMYRSMVFYQFFMSISLIVSSKFQFQDAIEHSKNISTNLYVKSMIENIIFDINNGMSISRSFEKTGLFDSVTIRLLLTAQKTNSMERLLNDIYKLYKKRLNSNIVIFSKVVEPLLMFVISAVVLWLVLAIMTPVWELGNIIG